MDFLLLLCFDKLKFYEDTDNDFIIPTYTNVNDLNKKDSFVLKDRFVIFCVFFTIHNIVK